MSENHAPHHLLAKKPEMLYFLVQVAKMDVILSRAGLSAAQQRTLCFDAVNDEVKQTEVKLTDAIASLKRLQDVVRVARDVHNAQRSVVTLPPDAEALSKGWHSPASRLVQY
ncbi:hypothetical protein GQ600_2935 [Phytophthora cactorum]|nr:hypothetical protein GQ600_2935 [Phytophthora cactorum]